MYATLELERRGQIATIWMNRPDQHNAFNDVLIGEMTKAVAALDRDDTVRVVVLAGRGRSFSAGADLGWMRRTASYSESDNLRDAQALSGMFRALARLSKPTIARVHGAAIGGGTGLTAVCDIAVAATDAVFGLSEVRLGIIPAVIGPYVLAAMGERQGRRYMLSGERLGAVRAHEIGLVHELCAADLLDGQVAALCTSLLHGGPSAQRNVKALLRDIANVPITDALGEATAERISRIRATAEAVEGITAFLDKRRPSWTGDFEH